MKHLQVKQAFTILILATALVGCKKSHVIEPVATPPAKNKIAFLYAGDSSDATAYRSLIAGYSTSVTVIETSQIVSTDLSGYDLIVAGDIAATITDPYTDNAAQKIRMNGKPIIYMGLGGNKLAQKISTVSNWMNPSMFTGELVDMPVIDPSASLYESPSKLVMPDNKTLRFFNDGSPSLAFYKSVSATIPGVELLIKADPMQVTFFSVAYQTGKDGFWGYYNMPLSQLTKDGKNFLINFSFYVGKLSL